MIDINKLIEEGAPEDVIMNAVKKNKEEKLALEEKTKAEKNKTQMAYRKEGRAHLINAILAYDDAFHFFGDEALDEEDIKDLEEALIQMEEMIPLWIKMLDLENKFKNGDIDLGGFRL